MAVLNKRLLIRTRLSYRFWMVIIPLIVLLAGCILSFIIRDSLWWPPALIFMLYAIGNGIYMLPFRHYSVDPIGQTLVVTNYLPKRTDRISFDQIESVVSTKENQLRGGPVRALYIKIHGKIMYRLTGRLFKNLDEIEAGFQGVRIIRIPEISTWKALLRKTS